MNKNHAVLGQILEDLLAPILQIFTDPENQPPQWRISELPMLIADALSTSKDVIFIEAEVEHIDWVEDMKSRPPAPGRYPRPSSPHLKSPMPATRILWEGHLNIYMKGHHGKEGKALIMCLPIPQSHRDPKGKEEEGGES